MSERSPSVHELHRLESPVIDLAVARVDDDHCLVVAVYENGELIRIAYPESSVVPYVGVNPSWATGVAAGFSHDQAFVVVTGRTGFSIRGNAQTATYEHDEVPMQAPAIDPSDSGIYAAVVGELVAISNEPWRPGPPQLTTGNPLRKFEMADATTTAFAPGWSSIASLVDRGEFVREGLATGTLIAGNRRGQIHIVNGPTLATQLGSIVAIDVREHLYALGEHGDIVRIGADGVIAPVRLDRSQLQDAKPLAVHGPLVVEANDGGDVAVRTATMSSVHYRVHDGPVTGAAVIEVGGRTMVFTGGVDGAVVGLDFEVERDPTGAGMPNLEPLAIMLPGYLADTPTGEDLLGIADDVDMLSLVIADRATIPPLSIGLFGNWGTGKTFFMNAMRYRIDQLAQEARLQPASPFCRNIAHVTFNAWHYAEANLWASLVSHLLEQLGQQGLDRDQLVNRLPTTRAVEQQLGTATNELVEAERTLSAFPKRRRSAEAAGATFDAFTPSERQELREALTIDDTAAARWRNLRVWLGGLWRITKKIATTPGRARRRVVTTTLVVFAVVEALLWVGVLARNWGWLVKTATVVASSVGAVIGAYWRVGRPVIRLLQAGTERTARIEQSAEQLVTAAEVRRDVARKRVEELEQELADIRSGRRLATFAAERAASTDYRQHLGIVAAIRRDFEDLRTLIAEADADGEHKIERIVLYIDDLDRCPAERVVEVLEAVHLILAFDLFVVVVGVDPRWLIRSLEWQYRRMLRPITRRDGRADDHWSATPMSYLEKIFQIPFGLRPMTGESFARLISGITPVTSPQEATDRAAPHADESRTTLIREHVLAELEQVLKATDEPPNELVIDLRVEEPTPVEIQGPTVLLDALRVTAHEIAFMQRLAPMIESPRETKRLVNAYRMIRATIRDRATLDRVVTTEHRAILLLLAAVIGAASEAQALMSDLFDPGLRTWRELCVRRGLPIIDEVGDELEALRVWAPKVARFSFHTMSAIEHASTTSILDPIGRADELAGPPTISL